MNTNLVKTWWNLETWWKPGEIQKLSEHPETWWKPGEIQKPSEQTENLVKTWWKLGEIQKLSEHQETWWKPGEIQKLSEHPATWWKPSENMVKFRNSVNKQKTWWKPGEIQKLSEHQETWWKPGENSSCAKNSPSGQPRWLKPAVVCKGLSLVTTWEEKFVGDARVPGEEVALFQVLKLLVHAQCHKTNGGELLAKIVFVHSRVCSRLFSASTWHHSTDHEVAWPENFCHSCSHGCIPCCCQLKWPNANNIACCIQCQWQVSVAIRSVNVWTISCWSFWYLVCARLA